MLVEPTYEAQLFIAQNMREIDEREVYALRWSDSPDALVRAVRARGQLQWVATARDGTPVYTMGVAPLWPGVWTLWGFSTDRWPEVMFTVTRYIRQNMLPMIGTEFAHRIDCMSLAAKVEGHKWLKFLGAEECAHLAGYGRNGEDFKLFTWR